jgi:hypothetical protein
MFRVLELSRATCPLLCPEAPQGACKSHMPRSLLQPLLPPPRMCFGLRACFVFAQCRCRRAVSRPPHMPPRRLGVAPPRNPAPSTPPVGPYLPSWLLHVASPPAGGHGRVGRTAWGWQASRHESPGDQHVSLLDKTLNIQKTRAKPPAPPTPSSPRSRALPQRKLLRTSRR